MEPLPNPDVERNTEMLQREIVDKNLNTEAFMALCREKKENGDDLNVWTYDELSQVVAEFVNSQTQPQPEPQKEIPSNVEPKKENLKVEDEVKAENIEAGMEKVNADSVSSKKEKEKELPCKVLNKSKLNDTKVSVELKNPKQESAGLLKNSYTLYEVLTQPFGWTVHRRYSDFDWLRKTLVKFFPGYYVPPIPHKKLGNRRLETDFIYKRMKYLQYFMNSLMKYENFKACEALVAFVSYTERNKFEQKMKELSSIPPITYIEDIKNLEGKIVLSADESNKKYFINIEKYFNFQTQILKKVNYNIKCFINNLKDASINLTCLSKNFELLFFLNNRVMMKEQITKTYEELQNFCSNWSKIFVKQKDAVQLHFKDFFKELKMEGEAFQEVVNARNTTENKYSSEFTKISLKKDKLFNTHDVNKFEISPQGPVYDTKRMLTDKTYAFTIMCSKDNANLEKTEKFMYYQNKMALSQLKTLVRSLCDRFYNNFKEFDAIYYPSINDVKYILFLFS
ncbi:MAG: hypothetical protein MJ252_18460 [archaeon]|nr:hypothetical protein [archaeon]